MGRTVDRKTVYIMFKLGGRTFISGRDSKLSPDEQVRQQRLTAADRSILFKA